MTSESSLPKFKPLSNSNYTEWSGEMKAWLMKLGYWGLVAGKEKQPIKSDPDAIDKWKAKVEKAAGDIYLAVESD